MTNLDDVSIYASADPSGMLGAIEGAADQWADAVRGARATTGLPAGPFRNVVYCGMGGSGIAGDVLQAVAAPVSRAPISVVKGYDIPASVGEDTLVLCVSYSGNTEETLSCFDQAVGRGASIVAISTGGKLAERARAAGVPFVAVASGLQPRAALPALTVPTIVVAEQAGVLPDMSNDLAETEEALRARTKELGREAPGNDAKRLARALDGKLPHVWGQDGILAVAAVRWRCQLNENAKIPASSAVLPELDHNELVGYDPGLPVLGDTALIVLRAPGEHPRVAKRIEITLGAMGNKVGSVEQVHAIGVSALTQLVTVALFGDFVSGYLAVVRGVDPTPVDVITFLKNALG